MPSAYQVKLPEPRDWEELQRLVCALFKKVWGDPFAQEYGRSGQSQNGVDIIGVRRANNDREGVQCKLVNKLSEDIIREDYFRSKALNPPIQRFIVATTARRDAHLQHFAAELTMLGPPTCSILFWDDICNELAKHRDLLEEFYSDFFTVITINDATGKYICIDDGITHYELLISRFPPGVSHYGDCLLIVDLLRQRSTTFRLDDHWSRYEGIVGITRRDAFVIGKWLRSFATPDDLFAQSDVEIRYRLIEQDEQEWLASL